MKTTRNTPFAILTGLLLLGAGACSENHASPGVDTGPDALALQEEILDEVEQVLAPFDRDGDAAMPGMAIQAVDVIPVEPRVEPEAPAAEDLMPGVIWVLQTGLKQTPQSSGTWNAALTRGQRLQVVKGSLTDSGFVRVMLPDLSTGFILADDVLVGEVEELFAFESSPLYAEPDAKATPKATLPLGTPLFVLDSQGNFVEVMLPGGERGWMLNTDLARDPEELTSARS
ncbi:MAG: SH3 domain-containing protein [Pseudomonadota bacterium]